MKENILKALGDPKRYRLLELMSERSYCVGALAHLSGLSESAVSQHLKLLREAGLVFGVKRGYYTHYCVDKDALRDVINELNCLLQVRPAPCESPFYGCPQAEVIACKAYVPPENRQKKEE